MGTIDALRSIAEQPRHPDMTPDSENGDVGEEHSHRSHAAAVVVFGRGPVQVATSPLLNTYYPINFILNDSNPTASFI